MNKPLTKERKIKERERSISPLILVSLPVMIGGVLDSGIMPYGKISKQGIDCDTLLLRAMECYATPLGGRGRLFFAAYFHILNRQHKSETRRSSDLYMWCNKSLKSVSQIKIKYVFYNLHWKTSYSNLKLYKASTTNFICRKKEKIKN